MDKAKAIELLKQALDQISNLRKLQHGNQDYLLWHDSVENIIKAGLDSDDAKRFTSYQSVHMKGMFPDEVYQKDYLDRLTDYETALKSIIQKYETLGILETPEAVGLAVDKPRAFISHGKGEDALLKLERFLKELGVETIIVKDQPSLDRTLDKKVEDCLSEADFVIIFATGDDIVTEKKDRKDTTIRQPRQNVIHEIGLAQKTHPGRIIYLLEEGAEFPSNIRPKVYESFARQSMDGAFTAIVREMRTLGFLVAVRQ